MTVVGQGSTDTHEALQALATQQAMPTVFATILGVSAEQINVLSDPRTIEPPMPPPQPSSSPQRPVPPPPLRPTGPRANINLAALDAENNNVAIIAGEHHLCTPLRARLK